MSRFAKVQKWGLAACAGLALSTAPMASAAADVPPPAKPVAKPAAAPCFFLSDWQGWSSPSENVLYLRVRMKDVYRLDLSSGSSMLQWPQVHLVTKVHGSDNICAPLDLDLSVSDGQGFHEGLIIKSITKLSPEEVAALPKKFRP